MASTCYLEAARIGLSAFLEKFALTSYFPTRRLPGRMVEAIREHRFGLAAFLIPLGIRAVPEIIVGPYPVGFDTIAFYVPTTLDWAAGKVGLLGMLGTAPLMYMISAPVYILTRANPVWTFKVLGPVLYGGMIWALFRFLQRGLKWSGKQSLGGALLTSLYFVTLRISWDLYRNMLGLTFILLTMTLLEDWKAPRKRVMLAAFILLAVSSDQLTGVIALVLVGTRTLAALLRKEWDMFMALAKVAVPGAALFLLIVYADLVVLAIGPVREQSPLPSVDSINSSLGFLAYAYLAIIPLVLLGLRKVSSLDLKAWSLFSLGAVAAALLPFVGLTVASYRWSILVDVPVCIYAAAGLSALRTSHDAITRSLNIRRLIVPIFSTALMASSILYIALPAERAMVYYSAFPALLPTSMVQDTVPSFDMASLKQLLDSMPSKMGPGTVLITHQAIYGWARAYLPASNIVNYGYSSPMEGLVMAKTLGYQSVLMIWWINGKGWHGQPNVPAGFETVVENGDMAVYTYH